MERKVRGRGAERNKRGGEENEEEENERLTEGEGIDGERG